MYMCIYIYIHKSMYACFFGGPPAYIYIYGYVMYICTCMLRDFSLLGYDTQE